MSDSEQIRAQKTGIQFLNIKKSFGPKQVLNDVSFDVKQGEVFFIIGASGVGKSVLIKHLVGLLYPDSGEIWLDGEEVSKFDEVQMGPVRKKCAMVFQHSTLFDSMTCVENLALPLRKHKAMNQKEALSEGKRLLHQVHMQDFADKYPSELGDGMRKRVAIARALTLDPRYVLFDEPTTSLDPVSARRVDKLIYELSDTLGVTSIVVSHDLVSIFTIAKRIVMLYKGKVRMLGSQADFQSCQDGVVHQFIRGHATGPMEM
jgi:phospholipid/cholesterol/gamma-HCH transport system ATP-binding protein